MKVEKVVLNVHASLDTVVTHQKVATGSERSKGSQLTTAVEWPWCRKMQTYAVPPCQLS